MSRHKKTFIARFYNYKIQCYANIFLEFFKSQYRLAQHEFHLTRFFDCHKKRARRGMTVYILNFLISFFNRFSHTHGGSSGLPRGPPPHSGLSGSHPWLDRKQQKRAQTNSEIMKRPLRYNASQILGPIYFLVNRSRSSSSDEGNSLDSLVAMQSSHYTHKFDDDSARLNYRHIIFVIQNPRLFVSSLPYSQQFYRFKFADCGVDMNSSGHDIDLLTLSALL